MQSLNVEQPQIAVVQTYLPVYGGGIGNNRTATQQPRTPKNGLFISLNVEMPTATRTTGDYFAKQTRKKNRVNELQRHCAALQRRLSSMRRTARTYAEMYQQARDKERQTAAKIAIYSDLYDDLCQRLKILDADDVNDALAAHRAFVNIRNRSAKLAVKNNNMERKKIKSIADIPLHERGCILPPNFMAQAIKWKEQKAKSNLRPHFAYKVK